MAARFGKMWEAPSGEIRYYVEIDDAIALGGLDISRYNSGNISGANYKGEGISNSEAKRMISDVEKVYYTEDGVCHLKWNACKRDIEYPEFWDDVKAAVSAKAKEILGIGEPQVPGVEVPAGYELREREIRGVVAYDLYIDGQLKVKGIQDALYFGDRYVVIFRDEKKRWTLRYDVKRPMVGVVAKMIAEKKGRIQETKTETAEVKAEAVPEQSTKTSAKTVRKAKRLVQTVLESFGLIMAAPSKSVAA